MVLRFEGYRNEGWKGFGGGNGVYVGSFTDGGGGGGPVMAGMEQFDESTISSHEFGRP